MHPYPRRIRAFQTQLRNQVLQSGKKDTPENEYFMIVTPTTSATGKETSASVDASQTISNISSSQSDSAALVEISGNNGNRVTATLPHAVSMQSEGSSTAQLTQQAQQSLANSILKSDTPSDDQQQLIKQAQSFINTRTTDRHHRNHRSTNKQQCRIQQRHQHRQDQQHITNRSLRHRSHPDALSCTHAFRASQHRSHYHHRWHRQQRRAR